jgi:biopolymer transport protein ExbB
VNNHFQTIVARYEDDFQLMKLLFLSFVDSHNQGELVQARPASSGGY